MNFRDWNRFLNAGRIRSTTRSKERDSRNEFESDFGRVVFSPAVRRMHDKTQVFPLTDNDNIHSRLTHSLEVMSVGYSIALNLSQNQEFLEKTGFKDDRLLREIPIIIKSACLVHDIGNPPFGHFGENVIRNYFTTLFEEESASGKPHWNLTENQRKDFTLFDGNAQGFRVLTKLQILDDIYGLNLTYATLGAFLKYPNTGDLNENHLSQNKRGVFDSEKGYLALIAENCGLFSGDSTIIRHPLSYIMEAADSICYLVMDIEDAYNKKWFDFYFIKRKIGQYEIIEDIFKAIEKQDSGEISENKKMVSLRLALIKYLVNLAVSNYIAHLDEICQGSYNKELIRDDPHNVANELFAFCKKNIFSHKEIISLELTGYSVLKGLLDFYIDFCFNNIKSYREKAVASISNSIVKASLLESGVDHFDKLDDYYKLRIIVDFISGMTDQYALSHFQKISGQKIS